jgi:hypothetical protein
MTDSTRDTRYDLPLRTDEQLRLALEDLLMRANQRQLWWIFLDGDDCLTGPFMPGAGYPDEPDEPVEVEDIGEVSAARVMAVRVAEVAEIVGAARAVLVWETPGTTELPAPTRSWVREMALASRATDLPLRAQFLLHDRGLRTLVPDDFI